MMEEKRYERKRREGNFHLTYNPLSYVLSIADNDGKAFGFDPIILGFPVRVVAEITSRCNQKCINCSQRNDPRGVSMSTSDVLKIIDEADRFLAFELSLRGGEATLHPDFDTIWNYAVQKEFTSISLVTNGILLNESRVLSMLKNRKSRIVVSLDGFEEINSVTRSPKQYSKVMRWLLPILAQKPEQITVLTTVSKHNYQYVEAFADYLSQKGLRHQNFTLLKRLWDKPSSSIGFISLGEMYALESSLIKISEKNPTFAPTICSPFFRDREISVSAPLPLFTECYCGAGMKIMNDGRVGISQMIHFDRLSTSSHGYLYQKELNCLGRLTNDKSLQEIWLSSKELRLRQALRAKKNYNYMLGLESHLAPR